MRRILLFSTLSLATAAFPTLHAQQTLPSQTHLTTPAAQMMASLTPSTPLDPAFASLPNAVSAVHPPVDAEFAIFSVPCHSRPKLSGPDADSGDGSREPCAHSPNPYHRFLDNTTPIPLTPAQKARLAIHDIKDPGNLATITYTAAFTIATNSHTAYGPGWAGFGRNTGYSLLQDATGEFFGTFLIPSIAHEDPHYHRMPNASLPRRFLHAVSRTVIAQSDFGAPMPNFSTLLTCPIANEIANLYVPGINGNGRSTVARIISGYAGDPVDNLITEFLPDVASRIHIRVIFVQRVLNQISLSQNSSSNDQYPLP